LSGRVAEFVGMPVAVRTSYRGCVPSLC